MKLLSSIFGILLVSAQLNAQCTLNMVVTPTANPGEYFFNNQSSADPSAIYTVDLGDGSSYTLNSFFSSFTYQYNAPGFYTWCITVYDSVTPCTDTYCDSINFNSATPVCDGYFVANNAGGNNYYFDMNGSASVGSMNHFWDFGDGSSSTQANPVHAFVAGNYNVCHTVTEVGGFCSDTYCDSVIVTGSSGSSCAASYYWYEDSMLSQTVNIINTSTGVPNLTYIWDWGDGSTGTGTFPTHTYNALGSYYVCLTIVDGAGCSSTYCDSISVTVKMQGFTINVHSEEWAGLEENTSDYFTLYPNPVQNYLYAKIDYQSNLIGSALLIFDIQGNKIMEQTVDGNNLKIDLSTINDGIYFMQIGNGQRVKFIKE